MEVRTDEHGSDCEAHWGSVIVWLIWVDIDAAAIVFVCLLLLVHTDVQIHLLGSLQKFIMQAAALSNSRSKSNTLCFPDLVSEDFCGLVAILHHLQRFSWQSTVIIQAAVRGPGCEQVVFSVISFQKRNMWSVSSPQSYELTGRAFTLNTRHWGKRRIISNSSTASLSMSGDTVQAINCECEGRRWRKGNKETTKKKKVGYPEERIKGKWRRRGEMRGTENHRVKERERAR